MDLNMVVLAGKLAAQPELQTFESGKTMMRLLVTVKSTEPTERLDVIPVVWWDPNTDLLEKESIRGRRIWVAGSVQRRFWSDKSGGRQSCVEVVASDVQLQLEQEEEESE